VNQYQKLATLLVRCFGCFLCLLGVTALVSRFGATTIWSETASQLGVRETLLWPAVTYVAVGAIILFVNKPLGWALARGLD